MYDVALYEQCKQLYLQGYSLSRIEKLTGFSRKKLSVLLKREGICIIQNNQKYQYNEDFFKCIDTEEKAYWLGFIYADGNVNDFGKFELSVALAYKDKNHLEKLRDILAPNKELSEQEVTLKGKVYPSVRLQICNKVIVQDLIKLGCYPRKTSIITFPNEQILPKHLQNHFIRGYFDGDGSLTINYSKTNAVQPKFSLLGTEPFLLSIQDIFSDYGVTPVKLYTKGNAYVYYKGGRQQCLKIREYLYHNATVYLERKAEKFRQL